jgi:hypothetical protein
MKKILLNVIATNKYIHFLDGIIESSDSFLFKESQITILVHTNMDIGNIQEKYKSNRIGIIKNHIEHENWPFTTLKRFHYFLTRKDLILDNDFSFYIDVDSLFSGDISESILPESGMIGTIHPCLFEGSGTPDRNPNSTAFIPAESKNRYFCGGFFGGSSREFIGASEKIMGNIEKDLSNNVMAIWHDESHLNKYFFENEPSVILDNHFSAAEEQASLYPNAKIWFLDKSRRGGHDFFRN